jgi:hypothetical protein
VDYLKTQIYNPPTFNFSLDHKNWNSFFEYEKRYPPDKRNKLSYPLWTYPLTRETSYHILFGLTPWQEKQVIISSLDLPPDKRNKLSYPLWTSVVAAFGADRSSSSYINIIFPGTFFYKSLRKSNAPRLKN